MAPPATTPPAASFATGASVGCGASCDAEPAVAPLYQPWYRTERNSLTSVHLSVPGVLDLGRSAGWRLAMLVERLN